MSKRHSMMKVFFIIGLSVFLIASTILGMVKIVIPAIDAGYNTTMVYGQMTYAMIVGYFKVHPNLQIVFIVGLALTAYLFVKIAGRVFHAKWASRFFHDFFE